MERFSKERAPQPSLEDRVATLRVENDAKVRKQILPRLEPWLKKPKIAFKPEGDIYDTDDALHPDSDSYRRRLYG